MDSSSQSKLESKMPHLMMWFGGMIPSEITEAKHNYQEILKNEAKTLEANNIPLILMYHSDMISADDEVKLKKFIGGIGNCRLVDYKEFNKNIDPEYQYAEHQCDLIEKRRDEQMNRCKEYCLNFIFGEGDSLNDSHLGKEIRESINNFKFTLEIKKYIRDRYLRKIDKINAGKYGDNQEKSGKKLKKLAQCLDVATKSILKEIDNGIERIISEHYNPKKVFHKNIDDELRKVIVLKKHFIKPDSISSRGISMGNIVDIARMIALIHQKTLKTCANESNKAKTPLDVNSPHLVYHDFDCTAKGNIGDLENPSNDKDCIFLDGSKNIIKYGGGRIENGIIIAKSNDNKNNKLEEMVSLYMLAEDRRGNRVRMGEKLSPIDKDSLSMKADIQEFISSGLVNVDEGGGYVDYFKKGMYDHGIMDYYSLNECTPDRVDFGDYFDIDSHNTWKYEGFTSAKENTQEESKEEEVVVAKEEDKKIDTFYKSQNQYNSSIVGVSDRISGESSIEDISGRLSFAQPLLRRVKSTGNLIGSSSKSSLVGPGN